MSLALRVLNLEDCADDAELNCEMLRARWPDLEFRVVANKYEFIRALNEPFDVILADYTMPQFDGGEALSIAQEVVPSIPFVFVSGTIGEDSAIEALKHGAVDYVLKHRLLRLLPVVDRALRERALHLARERADLALIASERKYHEVF